MENYPNKIYYNHLINTGNKKETITNYDYAIMGKSFVYDDIEFENYLKDTESENYLSDEDSSI